MGDLSDYREQINHIDQQLISLLEQRMEVVKKVAQYKIDHQMQVFQPEREQAVLELAQEHLQDAQYAPAAYQFMQTVMQVSRKAQQQIIDQSKRKMNSTTPAAVSSGVVGFQGVAGSFSEEAAMGYFGEACCRKAYAQFEDVFAALRDKAIDYGVLPIENSSTGAISKVYDLLGSYGFYIVGERNLKISQNLIGIQGATLESIRAVYSHAQGLEQSQRFLAQHPDWMLVPYHNTATSAKFVAQQKDISKAAIASERAAQIYGLQTIQPDIQDNHKNTTRFIVIARKLAARKTDKISIMFSLSDDAGTLSDTLQFFAQRGISLCKIESRPIPDILWNYMFYLDLVGDFADERVQQALALTEQKSHHYRMIGAYQSDKRL